MEILTGFVIAVVIALTGVGAGTITAPMLILFLHFPGSLAVGTALAYSAVVKIIVAPMQIIRRQVSYRVLGFMLLGGVPGVILGSLLFRRIVLRGYSNVLYWVLGAIMIFTSSWHIYRHFAPRLPAGRYAAGRVGSPGLCFPSVRRWAFHPRAPERWAPWPCSASPRCRPARLWEPISFSGWAWLWLAVASMFLAALMIRRYSPS